MKYYLIVLNIDLEIALEWIVSLGKRTQLKNSTLTKILDELEFSNSSSYKRISSFDNLSIKY